MFSNKYHEEAENSLKEGKIEEAIELYSKALSESKDDPNILSDRGVAYLHAENKVKCLEDLDKAIKLQPKYAFRYACRAFAKSHFKMYDSAIEDYEKAIELDPDDAVAHNNLGMLLEQKGYMEKANERFERADKLSKQEDHLLDVVDELEKQEEPKIEEERKEIDPSIKREEHISAYKEFKKVFTSKNQFKEFINFIKNGFKIK